MWLDSGNREPGPVLLQLVAFEGAPAAGSIALGGVVMPWGPDGTGQVVLTGSEGAFVSGGSNLPSRITFGTILAAGPTAWLIRGCSNQTAQTGQNICTVSAIDRRTGMVTTGKFGLLDGSPVPVSGTISPDGRAAAIVLGSPSQLAVIDMSSGKQILAGIHPLADPVWSLDGRYLFFSQDGTVEVFDRESGNVKTLGVDVRTTEAIAVRPSP